MVGFSSDGPGSFRLPRISSQESPIPRSLEAVWEMTSPKPLRRVLASKGGWTRAFPRRESHLSSFPPGSSGGSRQLTTPNMPVPCFLPSPGGGTRRLLWVSLLIPSPGGPCKEVVVVGLSGRGESRGKVKWSMDSAAFDRCSFVSRFASRRLPSLSVIQPWGVLSTADHMAGERVSLSFAGPSSLDPPSQAGLSWRNERFSGSLPLGI